MHRRRILFSTLAIAASVALVIAVVLVGAARLLPQAPSHPQAALSPHSMVVQRAVAHDISAPLSTLRADKKTGKGHVDEDGREQLPLAPATSAPDTAVQAGAGPRIPVTTGLSFAGVGNGDYGFVPDAAPPDTNGAVGATQYVQWVNESFAVFNKSTGAIAAGFPKPGNSVWAGFGGGCQTNNDGDPIAQYDQLANRWILTQFSVSTTPF